MDELEKAILQVQAKDYLVSFSQIGPSLWLAGVGDLSSRYIAYDPSPAAAVLAALAKAEAGDKTKDYQGYVPSDASAALKAKAKVRRPRSTGKVALNLEDLGL